MVYRVLASALLSPEQERLERLVLAAPEFRARSEPLRGTAPFAGWIALLERLAATSDEDARRMGEDHTTLFVSGAKGSCPPYESSHSGPDADVGMIAASVDTAYRASGFVLDADGEAPDHVAVELDFLSALCVREAEATTTTEAEDWRRRQHAFLSSHLLRWLPALVEAVRDARPDGFYADATRVALRFAEHDIGVIEALRNDGR